MLEYAFQYDPTWPTTVSKHNLSKQSNSILIE